MKRQKFSMKDPTQPLSAELQRLLEEDTGKGVSDSIEDRAFWHDDIDDHPEWYIAFEALGKHNDEQPLVTLLQSDTQPTRKILYLLGDLIRHVANERRRANKPRRGPPPTPAYDRTPTMAQLESALLSVKQAVSSGLAVKDALARESTKRKLPLEKLTLAYEGKHGGLRRARGRK